MGFPIFFKESEMGPFFVIKSEIFQKIRMIPLKPIKIRIQNTFFYPNGPIKVLIVIQTPSEKALITLNYPLITMSPDKNRVQ